MLLELNNPVANLKEYINNLKKLNNSVKSNPFSTESQESFLLQKIVDSFDIILTNNFTIKTKDKDKNKNKENSDINYYNSFIIKHFNTPLIRFFFLYNDTLSINNQKNWILLSILEKSFSDCILEIYRQNLDKKYYKENALIRVNKSDINIILKSLKYLDFKNIRNSDFDKYMAFLKEQSISSDNDDHDNILESQISDRSPYISFQTDVSILKRLEKKEPNENYDVRISKEFSDSIINNFYNFIAHKENVNNRNEDNNRNRELELNNENRNENNKEEEKVLSEEEEESDSNLSNTDSEEDSNIKKGLILNPSSNKFLPTDNLYQIKAKPINKEYDYNDKLIYKKKETQITNSLLLYLNNFYKKTPYHKFYNHKMHDTPISLKEQNYQCSICFKKFNTFFDIPIEPIYWCSYYMRFICKECIDNKYTVIPYFILALWKFDKYPISKNGKIILEKWYDRPIIYFKKKDNFVKLIPDLEEVVKIKHVINMIFDKMKCKNKFEFLKNKFGKYQYLALREILFSVEDLVEIKSGIFLNKIKKLFDIMVKHVSGECDECYIEGKSCKCESDQKLFLYDYKNVFYCPECDLCFHRRCKGIFGYMCGHE